MENDIISQGLIADDNTKIIKKLYHTYLVLIFINIIYSVFDLMDWYTILNTLTEFAKHGEHYIYRYKIRPIISIILLSIGLITGIQNYKGYGFILQAIEKKDATLSQKGFTNFYSSLTLWITSSSISTISIIYRLYVKA